MSVLPFILNKGTNSDLAAYRTGAAQDAVSEARVLLGTAARRIRDALFSDGVTLNGSVFWLPAAPGNVATSDFTVVAPDVTFPAALTGSSGFFKFSDTNGGYPSPGAGGPHPFMLYVNGGSNVQLQIGGDTNRRIQNYGAAQFLGKTGTFHVVRSVSGASATLYWNGVALTPDSTTTGGTPPSWADAIITTNFSGANFFGTNTWKGFMGAPYYINAVLTATEILAHAQSGRLPGWCELGTGSAVDKKSTGGSYTLWFTTTGTVSGSTSNAFTVSASATGMAVRKASGLDAVIGAAIGMRVRLNITVDAGITGLLDVGDYSLRDTAALLSGTNSYDLTITKGANVYFENLASVAGGTITINTIQILGPVFKPVIQPLAVVADAGANKIAGILTSGITPITEKRDWVIQGSTNTNGNQQLLGASVFFDNTRHAIDSIEDNGSGTPTVGYGSVSGGAQYVTAAAVAVGRNRRTLVTPFPVTNNLWTSCTDANARQHTIRGHLVD